MIDIKIQSTKEKVLIGVLSDTHIPSQGSEVPQQIIDNLLERKVDYIFHLGDFTSLDVYKNLQDTFGKEKVFAIAGNMNGAEIHNQLPQQRELEIFNHKIILIHGSGGPKGIIKRLNRKFNLDDYDIIIFGHIHQPLKKEVNGKLYLNPGTPTDKRFAEINTYGLLSLSKDEINFQIIQLQNNAIYLLDE